MVAESSIIVVACPVASPRALIHTCATILQCCTPYHAISIYCQAAANLIDRGRGGGNDLPRARRSALSECFIEFIDIIFNMSIASRDYVG